MRLEQLAEWCNGMRTRLKTEINYYIAKSNLRQQIHRKDWWSTLGQRGQVLLAD